MTPIPDLRERVRRLNSPEAQENLAALIALAILLALAAFSEPTNG